VARPDSAMRHLVDLEHGVISREVFVSEEVYQREQEHIFARAWLFVGHESQIPHPGDYFVSCMGEESVILTRDLQGGIHVLLNTCRHRGMKVCRYDEGNTQTFTCPYHGWTYSVDGRVVQVPGDLLGVPRFEDAYHGELDKDAWGLVHVAQQVNYKGTIWATWDPAAPPFLEYLGGMRLWLDALLDCRDGREGGSQAIVGVQKYRLRSNWKFAVENNIGDFYHGATTHKSVEAVNIFGDGGARQTRSGRPQNKSRGGRRRDGAVSFPALGHGARDGVPDLRDDDAPVFEDPVVREYYEQVYAERERRLAGQPRPYGGGAIFPNMSFHSPFPRTILVSQPRGPLLSESWRWYLVDADAPREVQDMLRHYFMRYYGPAGMVEQDDAENWRYASEASRGVIARRYPYNYQMGLGHARPVESMPGAVDGGGFFSEENARSFFGRWAQLMDATSWAELRAAGEGRANGRRRE